MRLFIPILFVWFALKCIVAYLALMNGIFKMLVGRTIVVSDVVLAVIYGYYFFGHSSRPSR